MTSRDLLPDYLQHGTPTDPTDPDPRLIDAKRNCWMPRDSEYGAVVRVIEEEHRRLLTAGLPDPTYTFRMACATFLDNTLEELYPQKQKEEALRSGQWHY
jgi:hypothetical protein